MSISNHTLHDMHLDVNKSNSLRSRRRWLKEEGGPVSIACSEIRVSEKVILSLWNFKKKILIFFLNLSQAPCFDVETIGKRKKKASPSAHPLLICDLMQQLLLVSAHEPQIFFSMAYQLGSQRGCPVSFSHWRAHVKTYLPLVTLRVTSEMTPSP